MKKRIIGAIAIACAVIWCIRYYTLNGTFAVHGIYQEEVYTMYDVVEFDDCMSYGGYEAPGYSIVLEAARIVDAKDYLEELGKNVGDFQYLSERYLELTLTVSNCGDYKDGMNFYGLPVIGTNWYAFYDNEVTACINPFFENNYDAAWRCGVNKNSNATVKIAYNLYENMFSTKQWSNMNQEKMWLWVTLKPIDKRIAITL